MKRRSLLNGAIAITVVVLGVALINLLIQGGCYLLLTMFKYPVKTLAITVGLTALLILSESLFKKVKNK